MPMVEFENFEQLRSRVGQEVAVSDWLAITQERINQFADATNDHQWIHVDEERATRSPFKGTIAHGFLTLSLIPHFVHTTLRLPPVRMTLNYGVDRVRFTAPVPAGRRVRARFVLSSVEETKGGAVDLKWTITIEIEGGEKPVCIAETISRQYPA